MLDEPSINHRIDFAHRAVEIDFDDGGFLGKNGSEKKNTRQQKIERSAISLHGSILPRLACLKNWKHSPKYTMDRLLADSLLMRYDDLFIPIETGENL
jgi:hypothetical protein